MPLNEQKLYQNGNGTREEAIQRPDRKPTPKADTPQPSGPQPQPDPEPIAPAEQSGSIASVKATQAQDSAAKTLNLAVQSKAEGLNEAAQRGANQAIEEVQAEFTAYANVLFQGTEAMTQAKSALREGLKQATAQDAVAVDFSDFFSLPPATAQTAIEGGKS
jgi:hypothetical protein